MTASRTQHIISSGVVLLIALTVTWLSFTQKPAEAFLFPRLISVFFALLAIWNFGRAVTGLARVGTGMDMTTARNMVPGLVISAVFILFAAKAVGFYVSATLSFLLLYTIYDSAPLSSLRDWGKRIAITAVFMAVIYALFAMLLKVQTPRGIFF